MDGKGKPTLKTQSDLFLSVDICNHLRVPEILFQFIRFHFEAGRTSKRGGFNPLPVSKYLSVNVSRLPELAPGGGLSQGSASQEVQIKTRVFIHHCWRDVIDLGILELSQMINI